MEKKVLTLIKNDKMKKEKTRKQENNMRREKTRKKRIKEKIILMIIGFGLLMILPVVSAGNMYDRLQSFESMNCSYIDYDMSTMFSMAFWDLNAKFGLDYSSTDGCTFIFDVHPYTEITSDFGYYFEPNYAELDYEILQGDSAELVSDGDFREGNNYWTMGNGWAIDYGFANHSEAGTGALYQYINLVEGKEYNVSFGFIPNGSASVTASLKGTSGTQRTSDGYYSEMITAGSGSSQISFSGEGNFYLYWVSVKSNEEYLLFLAKDMSSMEDLINFTAHYELFEPLLSYPEDYFLLDENLWDWYQGSQPYDPIYTNCADESGASIYTGNSGEYFDESYGITRNFQTSCIDSNTLSYDYCADIDSYSVYKFDTVNCMCTGGKCIPQSSELSDWFNFYGYSVRVKGTIDENDEVFYWYDYSATPGGILVDDNLLSSIISNWINS